MTLSAAKRKFEFNDPRRFNGRNYAFEKRFKDFIAAGGSPETFDGLCWSRIETKPLFVAEFNLKRNESSPKAFCPACRTRDKYWHGVLVFYEEGVYAAIGFECSSDVKKQRDETIRWSADEKDAEKYLTKIDEVKEVLSACLENLQRADKVTKKFGREARETKVALAKQTKSGNGLTVERFARDATGRVNSFKETIGVLSGTVALKQSFSSEILKVSNALRYIETVCNQMAQSKQDAAGFIIMSMEGITIPIEYIVKSFRESERAYRKAAATISGFESFFKKENLALIEGWFRQKEGVTPVLCSINGGFIAIREHGAKPFKVALDQVRFGVPLWPWDL